MPPTTLKRLATEDGSVSPPPTKRKITTTTTTTKAAVANFFKPASQKEPSKATWRTVNDSLLVCKYDKEDDVSRSKPVKIAAFDFDSTLITTTSGNRFAKDATDWKWWHASVEPRLRSLASEGYLLAILSNQAGITLTPSTSSKAPSTPKRLTDFKTKATAFLTALDLPLTLYAATTHDIYRKPRTGMWDTLLADNALSLSDVDLAASVFVGDAAGRTDAGKVKKDFSCSDRDMASNIGVPFATPEEFFLGEAARPFVRTFEPAAFLDAGQRTDASPVVFAKKNPVEVVVFVGSPGAGKSTFFWDHLQPLGFERVNQDILKTRDRCIRAASEFLQQGKSVAIDNTNADIDTRAHWIKLAATVNIPIRCLLFTSPAKLCEHNDTVRALGGIEVNPESRIMLPKMAFTGFASRYREPSLNEGFQDITKVDFQFNGTAEQREIWKRYWISS